MDIGAVLNNRYTLTARLGKGAMGQVYRATDAQTGQDVAVKIIARDLAFEDEILERFRREGEALRQLRHPNIVGFVDMFEHDGQQVIVMECVPGGSLHQLIKQQGALPVDRVRQIALDLCDALIRAHRLNIIHRDLKPENVLLAEDGTPRLTDFGVARLVGETARLTGTGTQIGTPYYMSPEAWQGQPLDAQTDIWSLGVMLYELLSGQVPFGGETLVAVMNKVLTAPLPDLRQLCAEVPEGMIQIIARMLARDKNARYQTMREVAADLERGAPVVAPAVSQPLPAAPAGKTSAAKNPPPAFTHNVWGIIGIILSLLGVAIGPGLLWFETEAYLKGPLWVFASLELVVALLLGIGGWRQERARPSRWGRWEAGLGLSVAVIALLVEGLLIGLYRPGGSGAAASPTVAPIYITEGTLGPVLFEDDFDGRPSARWQFRPQTWKNDVIDGRTVLRNIPNTADWSTGSLRYESWTDYAVQFDFKFLKPDQYDQYYFIIRGRTTDCPPTIQILSTYFVTISPDQTWLEQSTCDTNDVIRVKENDRNIALDAWHTVQYIFIGNRMRVFIDGQLFLDYTDPDAHIPGGGIMLDTRDVEFAIDNFRVNEIIPSQVAPSPTPAPAAAVTTSPRPACGAGETELFFDDFEDGPAAGWNFVDAIGKPTTSWPVELDDGNHVLVGDGHAWANVGDPTWTDYALRLRLKRLVTGASSTHLNILINSGGRYYLAFYTSWGVLVRDSSSAQGEQLASFSLGDDTRWHAVTISVVGGHVEVDVDGRQVAQAGAPTVLAGGGIGLENVQGQIWYDDVLVCRLPATPAP